MLTILSFLKALDTNATLFINGMHCGYLDNFMMIYTGRFIWIPLYLSLLVVMLRNFPLRVNIVCILFSILLVTINDQVTSSLIRPLIGRLRPSNLMNPISAYIHVVDGYRGGRYGFPSAHAANCFGAAIFVYYVFRRSVLSKVFAAWAILMCYSRVYLGVHYVGDVVLGCILGWINASIVYFIFRWSMRKTTDTFKPKLNSCQLYAPSMVCGIEVAAMLVVSIFTMFKF